MLVIAGVAVGTVLSFGEDLPRLRKGDLPRPDQTTKIYASDGSLLATLFAEQNRQPLSINNIPWVVTQAVIDIEDERFWTHEGVDFKAVARAVRVNMASGQVLEGGSTIEQQYVRAILISREKTLKRKIREAMLAYRLGRVLSKSEILERYLNTVYFGQSAYGIEAAAVTYFGKHAGKLTLSQAALLAGLIKSPNRLSPHASPVEAKRRRNVVLRKMYALKHVKPEQFRAALAAPLGVRSPRPPRSRTPYFTEYVKQQLIDKYGAGMVFRGGLRVRTTIDLRLQAVAERAWRAVLGRGSDPSVAIVAVDPRNGFIRAMVGGRGFVKSKYNLATQAHRQPGSAFKPFVLATALEEGMSPNKKIDSAPALIDLPNGGTWNVGNATEGSGGAPMRLRDATVHSVNAVFARLVMDIGPEKVAATAGDLGIRTRLENNPAIALGGMRRGVTPLEMASAYGSFAQTGVNYEPVAVIQISNARGRVIDTAQPLGMSGVSAGTAYLVTDILRDVIGKGTGTQADIGRPAAGKTGTTQSYRDAWFVGYVPTLAAAVWVGYPGTERPMTNVRGIAVKGGTFPAMIWARFMRRALAGRPVVAFRSAGRDLVKVKVCTESDLRATKYCPDTAEGQFVRGSEPRTNCNLHGPGGTATSSGGKATVPGLFNLGKNDAVSRLAAAGFRVQVRTVSSGPVGLVQSQWPYAGAKVARGSTVAITVAGGDAAGAAGAASGSGASTTQSGKPPVAVFSTSSSTVGTGQTLICDAALSWDPNGDISSYRWTFGDGGYAQGETVSHTYGGSGKFTVTLTVTDRDGLVDSTSRTVTVR